MIREPKTFKRLSDEIIKKILILDYNEVPVLQISERLDISYDVVQNITKNNYKHDNNISRLNRLKKEIGLEDNPHRMQNLTGIRKENLE